jgi:methylthioribose-1-phosphate isomerase
MAQKEIAEHRTVYWKSGRVRIIDQTRLPEKLVEVELKSYKDVVAAIRDMKVRGAPAIGIAAGFGVVLASKAIKFKNARDFFFRLDGAAKEITGARPTAVNISWAVERVMRVARENRHLDPENIRGVMLTEAMKMADEDVEINKRIGEAGSKLVKPGSSIATYCNAGSLATVSFGTALGVVRAAFSKGAVKMVFVPETRPRLQGARLTAFELKRDGIPFTLITDNMIGLLMKEKSIDLVVVGADRIASNGDVANKVGTYSVAVLAKEHGIPFYVAAPTSTIDVNSPSGDDIPIEERSTDEVVSVLGKSTFTEGISVRNPAFDVTPRQYVNAIITERGVVRPPYRENIKAILRKS